MKKIICEITKKWVYIEKLKPEETSCKPVRLMDDSINSVKHNKNVLGEEHFSWLLMSSLN